MKIKVGLIDDNPLLLASIGQMIACFEEIDLLFSASGHKELFLKLQKHKPQVLLMDIDMPEKSGIELTAMVKTQYPNIKILMLTVFDQEDNIFQSILAGANGYLLKDEKPMKIISSVIDVMNGDAPMSPMIARKALELIKRNAKPEQKSPEVFGMSEREIEILKSMADGLSYIEIGEKLFISHNTVRKHFNNIYEKLHVHNKTEAIKIGMDNRWF
jgi:DNA-binding NarL/FixJ family response regulator